MVSLFDHRFLSFDLEPCLHIPTALRRPTSIPRPQIQSCFKSYESLRRRIPPKLRQVLESGSVWGLKIHINTSEESVDVELFLPRLGLLARRADSKSETHITASLSLGSHQPSKFRATRQELPSSEVSHRTERTLVAIITAKVLRPTPLAVVKQDQRCIGQIPYGHGPLLP